MNTSAEETPRSENQVTKPLSVLYFLVSFPELTQTFVVNEIRSLIAEGVRVRVLASKRPISGESDLTAKYGLSHAIRYAAVSEPNTRFRRLVLSLRHTATLIRRGHGRPVARLLASSAKLPAPLSTLLSLSVEYLKLDGKPDLVHCHFGPAGRMIAKLKNVGIVDRPMAVVFHGYDITQYLEGRTDSPYEELFRECDLILPISDRWSKLLHSLGAPQDRIVRIRLGIDCALFPYMDRTPVAGQPVRMISVGRMTEKKGHGYSVEALRLLKDRRPDLDVRLDIVGGGDLLETVRKQVEAAGLANEVVIHGSIAHDHVRALLSQAHIFALPSVTSSDGDQEGIPVSIMEAMALGLPVISTQHSGIPELVEHGRSGLLVPERDPAAYSAAIEALVDDPERMVDMGRRGREIVEADYNEKVQAKALAETLKYVSRIGATC
jgi:colanic acid/amylovoran biosynthesis glycosyltransferase